MNIKNITYNSRGTIDMDINHPTYGWMPFTASPDDVMDYGRELYERAKAGEFGEIRPYQQEEE